jgi:hypothetical protein
VKKEPPLTRLYALGITVTASFGLVRDNYIQTTVVGGKTEFLRQ